MLLRGLWAPAYWIAEGPAGGDLAAASVATTFATGLRHRPTSYRFHPPRSGSIALAGQGVAAQ